MPGKGKGGKWDWAVGALRMWGKSDKVSASAMETGGQGLPVRGDLSRLGVAGPVYQGLAQSLASPTLRGLWPSSRSFIISAFAFSLWPILSYPLFMVWGKIRFENLDFCIWILNYSNTVCWEIRVYSYVTIAIFVYIAMCHLLCWLQPWLLWWWSTFPGPELPQSPNISIGINAPNSAISYYPIIWHLLLSTLICTGEPLWTS